MNKQERDELRKRIGVLFPYMKANCKSNIAEEQILHLLDQLDAYESVVEAAKEFVNFEGQKGSVGHVLTYSYLVTEVKALEGLEDED